MFKQINNNKALLVISLDLIVCPWIQTLPLYKWRSGYQWKPVFFTSGVEIHTYTTTKNLNCLYHLKSHNFQGIYK